MLLPLKEIRTNQMPRLWPRPIWNPKLSQSSSKSKKERTAEYSFKGASVGIISPQEHKKCAIWDRAFLIFMQIFQFNLPLEL